MTLAKTCRALTLAVALAAGATAAHAAAPERVPAWVPTWTADPAPSRAAVTLSDETVREIVRTAAGGREVRLRLSNAYGSTPLHIEAVSLALRDSGSAIRPGSSARVTFQGQAGVTIAPGAYVLSDPLAYDVPARTDLAVSVYVAGPAGATTAHDFQREAIYYAQGDETTATTLPPAAAPGAGPGWLWLDEVEVAQSDAKAAIATFGDSITDGAGPPAESHATWPEVLYDRMRAAGIDRLSVFNAGIGGNRLLHPGSWAPFGAAAVARFDRDVLAQPNVKAVIILLGINDIGQVGAGAPAGEAVSAEAIEHGLAQLAERAHERGIKAYVGTLTPFQPCKIPGYYDEHKEAEREAVNAWIRQAKVFDGVADFDKAVQDPAAPLRMTPAYDSGDHLHPSAAGDRAIAAAVPLAWFR